MQNLPVKLKKKNFTTSSATSTFHTYLFVRHVFNMSASCHSPERCTFRLFGDLKSLLGESVRADGVCDGLSLVGSDVDPGQTKLQ